jgi:hypothetical protein
MGSASLVFCSFDVTLHYQHKTPLRGVIQGCQHYQFDSIHRNRSVR